MPCSARAQLCASALGYAGARRRCATACARTRCRRTTGRRASRSCTAPRARTSAGRKRTGSRSASAWSRRATRIGLPHGSDAERRRSEATRRGARPGRAGLAAAGSGRAGRPPGRLRRRDRRRQRPVATSPSRSTCRTCRSTTSTPPGAPARRRARQRSVFASPVPVAGHGLAGLGAGEGGRMIRRLYSLADARRRSRCCAASCAGAAWPSRATWTRWTSASAVYAHAAAAGRLVDPCGVARRDARGGDPGGGAARSAIRRCACCSRTARRPAAPKARACCATATCRPGCRGTRRGPVRRFLDHFRPSAGVLMETEVWPNLAHACRRARRAAGAGQCAAVATSRLQQALRLRAAVAAGLRGAVAPCGRRPRPMRSGWRRPARTVQRRVRQPEVRRTRPMPTQLARGRRWRAGGRRGRW